MRSIPSLAILILVVLLVTTARGWGARPPAVLTLSMSRETLRNVEDGAGRWQFEGGKVFEGERHVAHYSTTRRVTTGGTNAQNTAMLTTTIFFLGGSPPENITLQGSHDFNSGGQVGSVSAASEAHSSLIGRRFSRAADVLTIH